MFVRGLSFAYFGFRLYRIQSRRHSCNIEPLINVQVCRSCSMLTVTVITPMNFKVKGCLFIEDASQNVGGKCCS